MADALYDLLEQYLPETTRSNASTRLNSQSVSHRYLTRLTTLSLDALSTTEPQRIAQSTHSNLRSLQATSSRSHKSFTTSASHLARLEETLPSIVLSSTHLRTAIPDLDNEAVTFSTTYSKSKEENIVLEARKNALLLSRNVDKLSDILELPSLLSTAISSAASGASGGSFVSGANYSQALDLFAHIKRLHILYPSSTVIQSILAEAELAMKQMTSNLITSLRGQNIRLAAAIRTVGWLRRVAPELASLGSTSTSKATKLGSAASTDEGLFGSLFLGARLANLLSMLEALAPLRDLADQETRNILDGKALSAPARKGSVTASVLIQGQQTERYLKRYIEIFREQSFATVSVFRNVFPTSEDSAASDRLLLPLPTALASFPLYLVDLLMSTLRTYLPNVVDQQARESLLMQVLYAAGSLGRLGADFSMMIALLEEDMRESNEEEAQAKDAHDGSKTEPDIPEWVGVIEKHKIQAARLEALAAGQDQHEVRRGSSDITVT